MKKILFITLIIIWCIVIFIFSNMQRDSSNSKSKGAIGKTIEITLNITNKVGITDKHLSDEEMKSIVKKLNKPFRKCMHASVYFILAILVFLALKMFGTQNWKLFIIPIIVCFIYACTDEFHQKFIDGRSSEFLDVLIDTSGATLGTIFINTINIIINKIKNKKMNNVLKID